MKIYEDIQKLYMSYMRRRFSPNYRASAPGLRGAILLAALSLRHEGLPLTTIGQRREHYCFALQAIVLRAPSNSG